MRLAYFFPTIENPFWQQVVSGLEERAKTENNVEVRLHSADDSEARQVKDLERLGSDADVVAVSACGKASVLPVIKTLEDGGTPVVSIDQNLGGAVTANVISGNLGGGVALGSYVVEKLGSSARVVVLQAQDDMDCTAMRRQSFIRALQKKGVSPVETLPAGGSRRIAQSKMREFLATNQPFNAVFAENDVMALGAVDVLLRNKPDPWPMILGFDAISEAVAAIRGGRMVATVKQDPKGMGAGALETAVKIHRGQIYEKLTNFLTQLITADNVDRFIPE
ncbi:MAG: sugar ABC transporter substrate-binding protein [bacterium]|nr:sugar ABC transporter substrate-binding protein [bacterium]